MSSIDAETRRAEDRYEETNDQVPEDAPSGNAGDQDYVSRSGQNQIRVTKDDNVEDSPYQAGSANSDSQLAKDESDAIDQSNIIEGRTRGAAKQSGAYREPGDDEGLPGAEDGTSSTR